MFVVSTTNITNYAHTQDALAACTTLLFIGCLVYAFSNSKPTTQRVLLRLMFQPVLATTLLFTLWLMALLLSLFVAFTH